MLGRRGADDNTGSLVTLEIADRKLARRTKRDTAPVLRKKERHVPLFRPSSTSDTRKENSRETAEKPICDIEEQARQLDQQNLQLWLLHTELLERNATRMEGVDHLMSRIEKHYFKTARAMFTDGSDNKLGVVETVSRWMSALKDGYAARDELDDHRKADEWLCSVLNVLE